MGDAVPPPGESRLDPVVKDVDALGFALSRLRCHLIWIDEHHAEFIRQQHTNADNAQHELVYLADSIAQAKRHYVRLAELLLAGYTFDPTKKNPMKDDADANFWRQHFDDSAL